jgi:hypothetical protein
MHLGQVAEGGEKGARGTLRRTCIGDNCNAPINMCNLYDADLWIMPTIGSERALEVAIAALESAKSQCLQKCEKFVVRLKRTGSGCR